MDTLARVMAASAKGRIVNPCDYGLHEDADGLTNATALQAAINAAGAYGKVVIPSGLFVISGTGDAIITIADTITIEGAGMDATRLLLASDIPVGTDIIRLVPTDDVRFFSTFKDFAIRPQVFGETPGRHVIYADVTAENCGLANLLIYRMMLSAGSGKAFHLNNPALVQDRFWGFQMQRCYIRSGISLVGLGDSISITDNVFVGPNVGIEATMVAGSSGLVIERNNMVAQGGAISIDTARNVRIAANNIEQTVELDGGYCITLANIDYDGETGVSELFNNKVQPTDPTSLCGALSLTNCERTLVHGNLLGTAAKAGSYTVAITLQNCDRVKVADNEFALSADCVGLVIDATSTNTEYKCGGLDTFNASFTEVSDAGIGTKGIWKPMTLAEGWSRYSVSYPLPSFFKDFSNFVNLRGCVKKSGEIICGDVITDLPTGFTPETAPNGGQKMLAGSYQSSSDGLRKFTALRLLDAATGTDGRLKIADALSNVEFVSIDDVRIYSPEVD